MTLDWAEEPRKSPHRCLRLALATLLGSFALLLLFLGADTSITNIRQDRRLDAIAASLASLSPHSRRKREERRLPNALIIGARKSGTRALLEFLNLHPTIRTARFEVHYFDTNDTFAKGLDWYREQMPRAGPADVVMEKTPAYFTSNLAPMRVAELDPAMKIILIVRDPVERTISDYTQVHYTKLSKRKPHEAFDKLVFNPATGGLNLDYKPVRNSLYVKHLRRWLRYFPLSQIHLVDGDAFVRDPLPELRELESFLGLEHSIGREQLFFNATKGFYCFRDPKGLSRCLGDSKGRAHVAVSAESRRRLAGELEPYNRRFFHLARRSFPHWAS